MKRYFSVKGIYLFMLILSCLAVYKSELPAGDRDPPAILRITDFGLNPDSGTDACQPVRAALDQARKMKGKVSILFPRGKYDFYKQTADTATYKVSGIHQCWNFTIAIHIAEQKNISLVGDSALFMMHGEMTAMAIVNSENILIKGIIIDHVRPAVSEFRVLEVTDKWIDVQIHPDSKFEINEQGKFRWINADSERFEAGTAQWYDPRQDKTRRTWDPSKMAVQSGLIGEGKVRFYLDRISPEIRPGIIYQTRFPVRKNQGALIYSSGNIEWQNVTIQHSPGLGFLGQFCHNLSFKHVRIAPDPASGRTCASFADGFHLCGCSGHIIIENCHLVGLQDDHMNIYGNQVVVVKKENLFTIKTAFASEEQQCDTNLFQPGDSVALLHPKSLLPVYISRIERTIWAENKEFQITLQKKIEGDVQGFILENLTKMPTLVEIRGNYLGRVPTRSILMYSSKKSVIENNIIHRSPMPAILIKTPDPPYYLQGYVEDLLIRNNVFYECGELAENSVIAVNLQAEKVDFNKPVFKNIRIVDNLFVRKEIDAPLLRARGTGGIVFRGNRIELDHTGQPLLYFDACSSIGVLENQILHPDRSFKIEVKHGRIQEIEVAPVSDWEIIPVESE